MLMLIKHFRCDILSVSKDSTACLRAMALNSSMFLIRRNLEMRFCFSFCWRSSSSVSFLSFQPKCMQYNCIPSYLFLVAVGGLENQVWLQASHLLCSFFLTPQSIEKNFLPLHFSAQSCSQMVIVYCIQKLIIMQYYFNFNTLHY